MKNFIIFSILISSYFLSTQKIQYEEVLSVILENQELEKYLHLELPERKILYVLLNSDLRRDKEIKLECSHLIVVTDKDKAKSDNIIEIKVINIQKDNSIEFVLFYPLENVEYRGILKNTQGKWKIYSSKILEL